MPFHPGSRLVRRRCAGAWGPGVVIGLVAALAVLIVIAAVWDPCPDGFERRCGTVAAGKLVGHACECVEA